MRRLLWAAALGIGLCGSRGATAQPLPSANIPAGVVSHENLWALDLFRLQLRDDRDNAFIFEQQRAEYFEAVNRLAGAELTWPAAVTKVTHQEVHLRPAQWGRTRLVLMHFTDCGVAYGNLRYQPPLFDVPPSTYRYSRHAAESVLEIGLEIDMALAQTLRRGDTLKMTGRIEQIDTQLQQDNSPDTLIYVADIHATREAPRRERTINIQTRQRARNALR